MRYISINDLKLLVKKKLYQLETGAKAGDYLVYDRNAKTYVGHVEGANYDSNVDNITSAKYFKQNEAYNPPSFIISELETFKGSDDWKNGTNW